jgi:hypothetical protein
VKTLWGLAGVALVAGLSGFSRGAENTFQRTPRHVSLLIGAGNYKYAAQWKDLKTLNGPRTDVVRMQHALRRWGFREGSENQRVLVDAQASKSAIQAAFRWLATRATDSSDVVVIYYSGHGSWAPDTAIDGVRTRDEGDNFDEGLVPWDARDPHNPQHLVLDDEINSWLASLSTRNVTIIVDACFSGTVTRGSPDNTSPSAPVARGPRPPPYATLGGTAGLLEVGRVMNHTLLTAATSSELAYEKTFHPGSVVSGIFTRFLAEALDGADPNTRLDELIQQVRTKVGEGQTPQLEGDRGARIFRIGVDVRVPARGYALVRSAGPRRVGLDVGALHSARKGALYDVYGPGETDFRDVRLAQVQVDSVLEASSFARILPGARIIPASARAILSRLPPGAIAINRLKLFVNANARLLRDSLATIEWLELVDRPLDAMAELRRRNNAYQVLVNGQQLPPLRGDEAGGRTVPVGTDSVRGYRGSPAALCTPLRRAYSIAAMNLVRNEQPPPPSRLKLDVRVLPSASVSPTRRHASVDTAYVGGSYSIWAWVEIPTELVQTSTLYLTVALAGYTTAPRVIWPEGTRAQTKLSPEHLNAPLLIHSNLRPSVPGVENIKAAVSSFPYDLRPLVDAVPRCPFGPRDIARGNGDDPLVVTGWTAVDRRIEVHTRHAEILKGGS